MKKYSTLLALLIFFSAPAFSQTLNDVTESAFCSTINKVIAQYPTQFERVKGEKIAADWSLKWESKASISSDSKCEIQNNPFSSEPSYFWRCDFNPKEDLTGGTALYEKLKNNLNSCTYAGGGIDKKEETFEAGNILLKQYTITPLTPAAGYEKMAIQLDLFSSGSTVVIRIGNPAGF